VIPITTKIAKTAAPAIPDGISGIGRTGAKRELTAEEAREHSGEDFIDRIHILREEIENTASSDE